MPRWSSAVGAGVGAGVFSAVVSAFILSWGNKAFRINGVGWVQQLPFPFDTPWFWGAVAFPIGVIGALVQGARRDRHARRIRELAEELDCTYAESFSPPPRAYLLLVFSGWSSGRHAMTSRDHQLPITVFESTTIAPGTKTPKPAERTIALVEVGELPSFDLISRTFELRLLQMAGIEGLTFDSEAANSTDAETIQRFTQTFLLSQGELFNRLNNLPESGLPKPPDQEDAIRRLFSPAVMDGVNQFPEYSIQSRPGYLAMWHGSGVTPDRQRSEFFAAVNELRSILTHPHAFRAAPTVPGRVGTDPGKQLQKLTQRKIGEAIGMFVGFIASAILMPIVMFQQGPKLGLGFFAVPFIFLGCILTGRVLGSGIGVLLPARTIEPGLSEDPAEKDRRLAATGCASLIGLFSGFFGGVILFSLTVFHRKGDNFGVKGALFFGSIFGGAFLGAAICGIVVNRLYRWRQSRKPAR